MPLPIVDIPGLPVPVTRLALGALPMGPLQRGLTPAEGARVVRAAVERGITFIDTATLYGTYEPIRLGLHGFDRPVLLATKTHGRDAATVDGHVEKARRELDRDVLDVMLLHCARTPRFDGSWDAAWDALQRHKAAGRIRLAGFSTHSARDARLAADHADIDVVHPLINRLGMGLLDGGIDDMADAIARLGAAGKFVYAMKALAGGHLIPQRDEAFRWTLALPGIASMAVGMVSVDEVEYNVRWLAGESIPPALAEATLPRAAKRLSILTNLCRGCGACVPHCENDALRVEDNRVVVDHTHCILCGYCAPHCAQFAIRMV